MLGHGAIGQFAIGEAGTFTAETITPDKWFAPLPEPVRFRLGMVAAAQQFSALSDPFPFVPFSWFAELSKPSDLRRRGLSPPEQQFIAADTAVIPVSRMTPWFAPLSEPVRNKRGLSPQLQQFFTADTAVIPLTTGLAPWYAALAEPVRFKPGLKATLQQFLAAPSQLRPNPTTTGVLDALETKDTFLGGARVFNRVVSGEVGVIKSNFSGGEVGVIVQALSPGTSGVIAPVAVPVSGSAVAAVTTAHVSIRII